MRDGRLVSRAGRLRLAVLAACAALWGAACAWDPSHPFEREAPPVKQAIAALDAGDAPSATDLLEAYLSTGACAAGKIGAPESLRTRPNGTFDLGLSLFRIGEAYGRRFGEEEIDAGESQETRAARVAQIDCALRIVQAIAADETQPIDLRARARYLEGNLHFLGGEYEQAVVAYDKALTLAPGMEDGGDEVGRDAAFNRSIALHRIDDKKNDAGNDGGGGDSGSGGDAGNEGGSDAGDGGDSGHNGDDGGKDSGPDAGQPPQNDPPDAAPPPPQTQTQDDRILDQLESTPTFQQEAARKMAQQKRRVHGMVDK